MKKLPTTLAIVFIIITLVRVAEFAETAMRAGWLGWLFSIGLGLGVYASAYWMRVSAQARNGDEDRRSVRVRRMALASLIFFVLADGFFNLSEVWRTVTEAKLQIAASIYGAFPTVAVALLGALQGFVDRIPTPPKAQNRRSLRIVFVDWVNHALNGAQEAQPEITMRDTPAALPQPAAQEKPIPVTISYPCAHCGRRFDKQQGLAAHMRRCMAHVDV